MFVCYSSNISRTYRILLLFGTTNPHIGFASSASSPLFIFGCSSCFLILWIKQASVDCWSSSAYGVTTVLGWDSASCTVPTLACCPSTGGLPLCCVGPPVSSCASTQLLLKPTHLSLPVPLSLLDHSQKLKTMWKCLPFSNKEMNHPSSKFPLAPA